MNDNIIKFYPKNAADNPDNVLEKAVGQYEDIVLIGWNKDGSLDFRSGGDLTFSQIFWVLSLVQHKIINGDYFA